MKIQEKVVPLVARVLMSAPFILAGISKLQFPEAMQGYMQAVGLPGILLYPTALLEIVGSLALILGWQVRWASLALVAFTVLATVFFHRDLGDPTNQAMALKNLAMVGGLLYIHAFGAGSYALGNRA